MAKRANAARTPGPAVGIIANARARRVWVYKTRKRERERERTCSRETNRRDVPCSLRLPRSRIPKCPRESKRERERKTESRGWLLNAASFFDNRAHACIVLYIERRYRVSWGSERERERPCVSVLENTVQTHTY